VRSIRLTDIAEHVGVSVATVSRAMRNELPASNPLRKRVISAANELGYRPVRNRTGHRSIGPVVLVTLGVKAERSKNGAARITSIDSYGRFVYGVESGVRENRGSLSVFNLPHHADISEGIRTATKQTGARSAVILGGFASGHIVLDDDLVPAVLLNAVSGTSPVDSVAADDVGGIGQVVRCLVDKGHRRIALWTDRGGLGHHPLREEGYRRAVADLGLNHQRILYDEVTDRPFYERMSRTFDEFLKSRDGTTAIVCVADDHALMLLRLAHEKGIDVPGQLSIAGFDNVETSRHSVPPLTTVDVNLEEMGREAARLLAERLKRPDAPYRQVIFRAKLVERGSVGSVGKLSDGL